MLKKATLREKIQKAQPKVKINPISVSTLV